MQLVAPKERSLASTFEANPALSTGPLGLNAVILAFLLDDGLTGKTGQCMG